jgi:hypothetical protein
VNRLFTALGVDYAQWKALTITALRLDFRVSRVGVVRRDSKRSPVRIIVFQLIFYGIAGMFMALAVTYMQDRLAASILVVSYIFVMIATAMLIEHNAIVISPTDYHILGYHPITSRTYFAARLTNVLVYTLGMTTAVGLVPAAAFFVNHGAAVGFTAIAALYTAATTTTLGIIVIYAWLVRSVGARRLRSLLSWLQMLVSFVVYGGFIAFSEIFATGALASFSVPRTPWLLVYPGTWFASWMEVAAGSTSRIEVGAILASLALLVALALQLRGRLSLEYAEQLGLLAAATTPADARAAPLRPGLWFRGGEARAVAILVRSQFRNDIRFRMGILGILPITVLYLIMGVRTTQAGRGTGPPDLGLVTMAILLFPTMLKANLGRSDAFRASWIFFASPVNRTRLIRSSRNVLIAFFLLPYMLFVGVVLAFFTDSLLWTLIYLLLTGLVSNLALLVATLMDPELPFSKPLEKARATSRFFLVFVVIAVLAGFLPFLTRRLYGHPIAVLITLVIIVGISLIIDRITRLRVERQAAHLEFQG